MAVKSEIKTPSAQRYAAAFQMVSGFTDEHIRILQIHYLAPDRTITATQLAHALGYPYYSTANSKYGYLGRKVGELLEYNPTKERMGSLVTFEKRFQKRRGEWHWLLRPEVAQAVELLGWVEKAKSHPVDTHVTVSENLDCATLLQNFHFDKDVRRPPDKKRQRQFCVGWEGASVRERTYSIRTLKRLTWNNLGYRLGKLFGPQSAAKITAYYEQFALHHHETHTDVDTEFSAADEVDTEMIYYEGAVRQVTVNAYERNKQARQKCLKRYGSDCRICGFNFAARYENIPPNFIHVHHLKQLADIGCEYEVDPVADLCPVCPNCHAVLHLRNPPYTIEELKARLKPNTAEQIIEQMSPEELARFRRWFAEFDGDA